MSDDKRDILDVLKFELNFLEQGGYGRSVRTPWKPTSIFQDSLSCINFNEPDRPHPCNECLLTDFVPSDLKSEDVPCHHIALNSDGETVNTLERQGTQIEMEEAVKQWLRDTIERLEAELNTAAKRA
jgi:CO dehydrogenase/acetyl-CoA synthase gamma subunit (corrinoid Fe-S protein)